MSVTDGFLLWVLQRPHLGTFSRKIAQAKLASFFAAQPRCHGGDGDVRRLALLGARAAAHGP